MRRFFRDLLRGYRDADAISLRDKLAANQRPGAVSWISRREMCALRAGEGDILDLTPEMAVRLHGA